MFNLIRRVFEPVGGWVSSGDCRLFCGDKSDFIGKYISGKKVLDCGCVGERVDDLRLHDFIREKSSSCVGLDMRKEKIKELNEKGYNIIYCDFDSTSFPLPAGERFDVVVAGEVIEHLSSPGMFLEQARSRLKDGGVLILSTPNPFYIQNFIRLLLGVKPSVNHDHKSWFDAATLKKLLDDHGFTIREIVMHQRENSRRWIKLLARLRKSMASNMIVVAEAGQ